MAQGDEGVFAALVLGRGQAVEQAGVAELDEVEAGSLVAEGGVLGETAVGVVLGAEGEVHGAAEDEVELLAKDEALGGAFSDGGNEEAGLTFFRVGGVADVGEVEEGDVEQVEDGVVAVGGVVGDGEVGGGEEPVGIGAGGRR